jgi:hypothetical protein
MSTDIRKIQAPLPDPGISQTGWTHPLRHEATADHSTLDAIEVVIGVLQDRAVLDVRAGRQEIPGSARGGGQCMTGSRANGTERLEHSGCQREGFH